MIKDEIIKRIEAGLLSFYLEKNDESYISIMKEEGADVNIDRAQYENFSRRILIKARAKANEEKFAMLLSIAQTKSKLNELADLGRSTILDIFNRYIREHGLAINYKNLEEMDEEEIREILKQIDLTDLINGIDSTLENE